MRFFYSQYNYMYTQKTLENGLKIISAPMLGTKTCTLLVLVKAGSRYEEEHERGTAHFLEHIFFKGGGKFKNAKEVSEAIDSVGGDFNAFTGKEYVGYYVKVASEQKTIAFEILSDMLLHATFDPEEIDKERGVILEEMNMYEDMPRYKVGWDFEELILGNHPIAFDTIGTKALINSITQADFQKYKKELYTADNTVIVASGDILSEEVETLIENYFVFGNEKKQRTSLPFEWQKTNQFFLRAKNTEQTNLVIGYPGLGHFDSRKSVQSILSIILGGGMSSRMFLNVREEKGLCYSIYTSTDKYSDCGIISTTAGVNIAKTPEAISAIVEQYNIITQTPPSEQELQKAKNFLKGKMTLRMEDSEEVANFIGIQAVLKMEMKNVEDVFASIDAVTAEDVFTLAKELFTPEKLHMSVIGPLAEKENELKKALGL